MKKGRLVSENVGRCPPINALQVKQEHRKSARKATAATEVTQTQRNRGNQIAQITFQYDFLLLKADVQT